MIVKAALTAHWNDDGTDFVISYDDPIQGNDVRALVREDGTIWLSEYDDGISDFQNTRQITIREYFELVAATQNG